MPGDDQLLPAKETVGKRKRKPPANSVKIGTAGFDQKGWRGPIYPPGTKPADFLTAYQARFSWVEINSTAYHIPTLDQVNKWAAQCSKGFQISLKVPMQITHEHRLGESSHGHLQRFVSAALHLGDFLGPVLLQIPRSLTANVQLLRELRPYLQGIQVAFEPRHGDSYIYVC